MKRALLGTVLAAIAIAIAATAATAAEVCVRACGMSAPVITDGLDDGITINTTHVEYRFASASGKDKDKDEFECRLDSAGWTGCASPHVIDSPPDGAHTFAVRQVRGPRTGPEATRQFTVDTQGPVVEILTELGDSHYPAWPVLRFAIDDANAGSTTCTLVSKETGKPVREPEDCDDLRTVDPSKGEVCDDTNNDCDDLAITKGGDCDDTDDRTCARTFVIPQEPVSGSYSVLISHVDRAGNTGETAVPFVVDRDPPSITLTDFRDIDSDGDGFADAPYRRSKLDVHFETGDTPTQDGVVPNKTTCGLLDVAGKPITSSSAKIVIDRDTGRSRCEVADAPEGPVYVEIRAVDKAGNTGTLKRGFVVDAQGPVVTLTCCADADGDGLGDELVGTSFVVTFKVDDKASGVDPSSVACDVNDPSGLVVPSAALTTTEGGYACAVEWKHHDIQGLDSPTLEVAIRARDLVGNEGALTPRLRVATTPF